MGVRMTQIDTELETLKVNLASPTVLKLSVCNETLGTLRGAARMLANVAVVAVHVGLHIPYVMPFDEQVEQIIHFLFGVGFVAFEVLNASKGRQLLGPRDATRVVQGVG